MRLTSEERDTLRLAARDGVEAIDKAANELKWRNPEAFHNRASLSDRIFIVEPSTLIPKRGAIRNTLSGQALMRSPAR